MTTMEKTDLEPDPLWGVEAGAEMTASQVDVFYTHRRAATAGCFATSDTAEDVVGRPGVWGCSRRQHPEHWKHIATDGGDYVYACWGGIAPEPDGEPDADPGPFELEIGVLYKFRNKSTVLMVVGVRKDAQVEVLDLTHEKFRVLKPEQLVPRKADAEPPTPEQMKWVGEFLAQRRKSVRDNALKQRRDGYFNRLADLNGVLNELGMEPYRPRRTGTMSPPLSVRTVGLTDDQARQRLAAWLNTLELPSGFERVGTMSARDIRTDMRDESR